MSNLKHLSRRVKAYPLVPSDLAKAEALQTLQRLDKKLDWACWGFIGTLGSALLGALVILILEVAA